MGTDPPFDITERSTVTRARGTGGLDQALRTLRDQPFGALVLGITAGGLIIYGIYLFVLSYYHKIFNT
ncbi:DUF1206 domain-containing protein [Fodinibius sediminis]|uniref:DUF1206 domain-containing protein n=1 Tax=Fodinibius sediminis TaxID=1214077 RepID=A0A521FF33_9BACT|nr:DUF1206 domain-containing protein [Fodinibius sediminis]SMO94818.1 protein of unknown function [Fodinibius sediminis]